MKYDRVDFRYESPVEKEIISDILAAELGEIGFESFSVNESGLEAFIPEKQYEEARLQKKLASFPLEGVTFHYNVTPIPDRDWNEEWEKNYFRPIVIGSGCAVRASFHPVVEGVRYEIVIDPRMAFGTGNHETTFLMLSEMLSLDLQEKSLLDMGCGTAVLAILAAMKRCRRTVAVDIDEWAYRNALDNIRLNRLPAVEVKLGGAEVLAGLEPFDFIFANINRNILLSDLGRYGAAMKPGADLFMSGFYREDLPLICAEAEHNRLDFISSSEKNRWVAARFRKQGR